MLKRCTRCGIEKTLTEFRKDRSRIDGYRYYCKTCQRLTDSANYTQRYGPKYKERHAAERSKSAEALRQYKLHHPCVKCGESDISCLEFHHLDPATKLFGVGEHTCISWERRKQEIEKCIVLCANCHRKFHAGRFTIESLNI